MAPLSVLIVGCGVAGPTLATFLLLSRNTSGELPHITIVEWSSSLRVAGQNIDIRGVGVPIIRSLWLEKVIRSSTTGEEGVRWVDDRNRTCAEFPADKSGKIQTGTSDIEMLRGRLADILYRRSEAMSEELKKGEGAGIEYIFGDYFEALEQDEEMVHVRFAKSGKRSFDLVGGADGLQSQTRGMVFGEEGEDDRVKRLGMYGAFFSMPKGETDNQWRRWFHAPGRLGVMVRPSEQADKSTVFTALVNDKDERLREAVKMGHAGITTQRKLLKEYFRDAGWESERIIKEMEKADDFYYAMGCTVQDGQMELRESRATGRCWVSVSQWIKAQLTAHSCCGSPLSGMGTSLGMKGAYDSASALVRKLLAHSTRQGCGLSLTARKR